MNDDQVIANAANRYGVQGVGTQIHHSVQSLDFPVVIVGLFVVLPLVLAVLFRFYDVLLRRVQK